MKQVVYIILSTLFFVNSFSQKFTYSTFPLSGGLPFRNGEELNYSLKYGFIKGGEAIIRVSYDNYNSKDVVHAVVSAKTTGITDKVFKVLDTYESYFTMDSNLPLRSVRNIREGSYKFYGEDHFNHELNTVMNVKKGIQKMPDNILDIISAFFMLRRIDFKDIKVNDTLFFNTYFSNELFPFCVVFKGREEVSTSAGKFKCLKFLPIVEPGRVFKDNDDMLLWLSDDKNKIPVKIKFDLVVGSFKCEVEHIKNVNSQSNNAVSLQ